METMKTPVKTFHCIISYCFIWKDIVSSRFHLFLGVSHDETLSLVFYVLRKNLYSLLVNVDSAG